MRKICSFQAPNGLDPVYVNPALMQTFKHTGVLKRTAVLLVLRGFAQRHEIRSGVADRDGRQVNITSTCGAD
jgi:hypothetical protein